MSDRKIVLDGVNLIFYLNDADDVLCNNCSFGKRRSVEGCEIFHGTREIVHKSGGSRTNYKRLDRCVDAEKAAGGRV